MESGGKKRGLWKAEKGPSAVRGGPRELHPTKLAGGEWRREAGPVSLNGLPPSPQL